MSADYTVQDAVAVIRLHNPPLNALDLATRQALHAGLQQAAADARVQAVVLCGSAQAFSAGADIQEFASGAAFREPNLATLVEQLEHYGKPVVAALSGLALGGGLELALACSHRVAEAGCRIALPEVKLGLVPGAGGTQRLPRALGVEPALNLMLQGEAVPCATLFALPQQRLLERLAGGGDALREAALALAREAAQAQRAGAPLPRLGALECAHPRAAAYFAFARSQVKGKTPQLSAPQRCIDLVEAATQQRLEPGLALEQQAFRSLMATPESIALRHVFAAERAAAKGDGAGAQATPRPIEAVAVVGAGTMGSGIAMALLDAGLAVQLLETRAEALERGLATIRGSYEAQCQKGRLSPQQQAQRLARLGGTLDYEAIAQADLVIEAVFEDMEVKQAVFRALDRVMKPGAILASNTSTLDLDALAACTRRASDVVGLHFFSPAHVMKLLEVVRGAATAPEVLASAMALGRRMRKTCVVAGVCDGFIGNRMLDPYLRQAAFLVEEGCTPQQVDRAMEKFGWAMGPFRMSDMAGNDIGWSIRKRHYRTRPEVRHSHLPDRLCEQGRFGQKSGAGWYDYRPGQRQAQPSAQVQALVEQHRQALGLAPRRIGEQEIVLRLLLALVNEGARILEEGIAARASDIDMVYLTGYGFPAWRGGPMHYAEQLGLFRAAAWMQRFAAAPHGDAAFWQPARLLQDRAAGSGLFSETRQEGHA